MIAVKQLSFACALGLVVFAMSSTAEAHSPFKKTMQAKYPGMKVSCNACHVAKKPKTERNEFGKLFSKEMKKTHPNLTKDYPKKGDAKKAYEKATLIPAFEKALKVVKAAKNKKGEVYDDLIKAGKIAEIKKDPKYKPPVEGAGSSKKSG